MIRLKGYSSDETMLYIVIDADVNQNDLDCSYNYLLKKDNSLINLTLNNTYQIEYVGEEIIEIDDVIEVNGSGIVRILYSDNMDESSLFITSKCNSNCIMCPSSDFSRKNDVMPDLNYLLEILRYYPNSLKHLTITGGEPFIIKKELFAIFEYIKNNKTELNCLLLTNGRAFCLNSYVDDFLKYSPKNMVLGIPLHGSNSNIHDHIVRSEGAFDQTVIGISNLLKNNVPIELRIVPSKLNIDDIDNICDLIINNFRNVFKVTFISLEMLGNSLKNKDKVWIPIVDILKVVQPNIEKLIKNGINVDLYNFPLCLVNKKFYNIYKNSILQDKIKYSDKCEKCAKRNECGGLFFSSLKFAYDELKPFEYEN